MFHGMRYIYEVYKEMSFSKAAENLYISQPSLSAAVKKAENLIGFPVFDRSTTPIRLTEPGKRYIESIETILDVERGFENYIHDMNNLKSGSISIGGTNLFISFILPPVISRYTSEYPLVDVNLVEDSTSELREKLFSGKLDLIIDNHVMDPIVCEKKFFCEEHLVLIVPRRFASNEQAAPYLLSALDIKQGRHLDPHVPPVPLELFRNEPFLFLKSGNDTRIRADKICHNDGFSPKIKLKLDQQITAYNLSSYGMGAAFIGDILIKSVDENKELLYYKLDNRDATRNVNFYYKRNRYMSRTMEEFLKMV